MAHFLKNVLNQRLVDAAEFIAKKVQIKKYNTGGHIFNSDAPTYLNHFISNVHHYKKIR